MASASVELQDLIFARLKADAGVGALIGDRIYDQAPTDAIYPHVTFGAADFSPADADCITGRVETVQLDVWSRDQGRVWPCKAIIDAVKAALHDYEGTLATNALVTMRVTLARVQRDPDGITAHGVVQVSALIEEA